MVHNDVEILPLAPVEMAIRHLEDLYWKAGYYAASVSDLFDV
jgi:hypothetical protein